MMKIDLNTTDAIDLLKSASQYLMYSKIQFILTQARDAATRFEYLDRLFKIGYGIRAVDNRLAELKGSR